jgi:outer membrane lipoprotein-sorting protein
MKRWLLVAGLLMASLAVLAGCGGQVTAQEIVQHMRDTAAKTDSAHFVVTVQGQVNGQSANAMLGGTHLKDMNGNITLELWYQKPNLLRAQIVSSSHSELNGAFVVHDGTYFWAYEPTGKIAYKLDDAALRDAAGKANIPADLQDLLANPNLETMIDQVLELTDYTVGPSEQVGAYQTYRLDLKPKAGSPLATMAADAQGTLWVDQTTWAPIKATLNAKQGSGSFEMTTLELNKTLPASTFQFVMPQGGHTVDLSGTVPHSMTLDQARQTAQAAGYHLLEPSYVPANATLVQVMASRGLMGQGASVSLNYNAAGGTFWISEIQGAGAAMQQTPKEMQDPSQAQTVTVRGVQGHFATHAEKNNTTSFLWWKEAQTNLTVAIGGGLGQDELLKIAEGLK